MTTIALLGDHNPAYVTHRALDALAEQVADQVELMWVPTRGADVAALAEVEAVWAVPGTPYADDAAVHAVLRHRRERRLPTLGTCGGFQHMVVEFARNVAGLDAGHGETEPGSDVLVVTALACSLVGEVRMVECVVGTRIADICGTEAFPGFHFCGYGVAPEHEQSLVDAGLTLSAFAPDAGVEAVEIASHPFYVGTLFQPQMGALDGDDVHPLISAFIAAAHDVG